MHISPRAPRAPRVTRALLALLCLLPAGALAQPAAEPPCPAGALSPCLPPLVGSPLQKGPSVFHLQARVSRAKLPSGEGKVDLYVNISDARGEVLCKESFGAPVLIRDGVLNVEVGRGVDCALDEVLAERGALYAQLCLGSATSCLRPIELTAVPFALAAHMASEALSARAATQAAQARYAHRATADADVLFPAALGYGYFDLYTHAARDRGALYPSEESYAPYADGGFLQWAPVRGDVGPEEPLSEDFNANQLFLVGEDEQQQLSLLSSVSFVARRARVMGRVRVMSGHLVTRGATSVSGELRARRALSAPRLAVVSGDLAVTDDGAVTGRAAVGGGLRVQRGGLRARAQVSAPAVEVGAGLSASQAAARLGAVESLGPAVLSAPTAVRVGGAVRVEGSSAAGGVAPQGLSVRGAARVGGETRVLGETTLTRPFDPSAPGETSALGLSLTPAGGAPRRVLSQRQSGVLELNLPARRGEEPFSQVHIKARRVVFEDEAVFADGRLGGECELVSVGTPEAPKLNLRCGEQVLSFASDQCGNGRRFRCACGDGNVDPSEECDDGDQDDADACRNRCALGRCGDGVTRLDLSDPSQEGYEGCDDANDDDLDACLSTCRVASCGDSFLRRDLAAGEEGYEECDDGNLVDSDDCTARCTVARCGDGALRSGREECDDGNLADADGCDARCVREVCGNGVVQAGERCDDGNSSDSDSCVACQPARCGDGVRRLDVLNPAAAGYEECDDGNDNPADSCVGCRAARCGDGVVRAGVEQCDDGGVAAYDGCTPSCRLECSSIDWAGHLVDAGGEFRVNTRGRRSGATSAGGGGPQVAIGLTLTARRRVVFEVTSQDYDSYLHLRRGCDDLASVADDDDSGGDLRPRIGVFLDPGTYYLIVDGFARSAGAATVRVSVTSCAELPVVAEISPARSFLSFFWRSLGSGSLALNTAGGAMVTHRQCGGNGPQKAVRFTMPFAGRVRFSTRASFDSVLHIRRDLDCDRTTDITCDDDSGPGLNSDLSATLAAGVYYVIVDGYAGRSGDLTLYYEIN